MNGLQASGFRRIHIGLLLDLILFFLLPAVLAILLTVISRQFYHADAGTENITVTDLLANPSFAIRALYAFLALQYCLSALCKLLIVSGLGETEPASQKLQLAKRWFILLMVTDGIAMLAHISDVMIANEGAVTITSTIWSVSILVMLLFLAFGLCTLLCGYNEVLESVGMEEQARHALLLSRRVAAAVFLLILILVGAFSLTFLDLVEPMKDFMRFAAAGAIIFYVVCRIQIVRCARSVTELIAALSE